MAASAPTAPNMQIDAPTMGSFDEGQSGELPFEI
jgi:single-strand DNA-binding protein